MEQYVNRTYGSNSIVRGFMEACTASYGTVPYASSPVCTVSRTVVMVPGQIPV